MKVSPFLEQIFHIISKLLKQHGHDEIASQLDEKYPLPEWIETGNPLIKKGLIKIVKQYVKNNEKMIQYYQTRSPPQVQQEVIISKRKRSSERIRKSASPKLEVKIPSKAKALASPEAKPVKQNTGWMAKFQRPKRLQEAHLMEEEAPVEEIVKPQPEKKSKDKKKAKPKIQSSDYESDEDSFELEPKKKMKKEAKVLKIQEKKIEKPIKQKVVPKIQKQEEEVQEKQQKPKFTRQTRYYNESNQPKKFFSRINVQEVGQIRKELNDNSFQAKAKFGQQADHWGQFGFDKLKDTRGDSFKKTKGKLKNRAFQGMMMDVNKINSIRIE